MQTDTDPLLTITSTADDLFGGVNNWTSMTLN